MTSRLEASGAGRAGKRQTVKRAALVHDSTDVLRTNGLNRTADLVDVLTEIAIQVTVVVAEVSPLQFTHRKLRGKLEGSFASVALRDEAFERITSNHEHDLVRGAHPSRVTALSESVGHSSADDGVNKHQVARTIESSGAERLLVDTKSEPTVAHELIARDALFTQAEGASRQIVKVFLNVRIVAEVFDLVSGRHHLEELAIAGSKRLSKHLLTEERADLVQRLEVHRAIRQRWRKQGINLLHIASKVLREGAGAINGELDARLNQVLIADVGIDDLQDSLLKGDLGLQIAAFKRSTSLFHADTGASATKSLKLELVFRASDLIRGSTNAAKRSVVHEGWRSQRGCGNRHFFDNGTDNVRDVRKRPTIDGVNIGRFARKNATNLPNDTIYVLRSEILNCRCRDTFISHSFRIFRF